MKPEPQQFSVDVNKKAPFLSVSHTPRERERHAGEREKQYNKNGSVMIYTGKL
jgi:hypothetical protein